MIHDLSLSSRSIVLLKPISDWVDGVVLSVVGKEAEIGVGALRGVDQILKEHEMIRIGWSDMILLSVQEQFNQRLRFEICLDTIILWNIR